jgi:Lrp/AsnC family leucine-responsive transcriptional regulator
MQNFKGTFNIDDISLKILGLLQENARMSYTEIGQKIGMTSSSVKERVQKLEEMEIIEKYTVKLNNEKIGFPITAITLWKCADAYIPKEQMLVDILKKYPQVMEVLRITGKNDFMVKFCAKTMEECKEITDKLGRYGQIETSFVVTSFVNNQDINFSAKWE